MSFREYIRDKLERSPIEATPEQWMGYAYKTAVPFALVAAFGAYVFTNSVVLTLVGAAGGFAFVVVGFVFALSYLAARKGYEVEEILPEALELIGSNVRAGLPIKNSLQLVMSEEFGQLGREVSLAATEMSAGASVADALRASTLRVDSRVYAKTVETLAHSIETGVNLDVVCFALAKNINDMQNIRRDIRASTTSYTLFLVFAALIASPLLFALSSFLVESSTQIFSIASAESTGGGNIVPSTFTSFTTSLPPVDLLNSFFLWAIAITAAFTSLGVGIVRSGDIREGIKMSPVFVIVALLIFFVARTAVSAFIGPIV